jgi:microcompartment protein CcmK/EutM
MLLARVTGTLVATQKHRKLEGAKLLFVQPLTLEDTPRGPELLAVDGVGAGGPRKSADRARGPFGERRDRPENGAGRCAIVGIVDRVDLS